MKGGHRWDTKVTDPRTNVSQDFTVQAVTFVKATEAARDLFIEGLDPSAPDARALRDRLVVECRDLGPMVLDPLPDPTKPRPLRGA